MTSDTRCCSGSVVARGRKPIFPGKDYVDQLQVICKLIGTPSEVSPCRPLNIMQALPLAVCCLAPTEEPCAVLDLLRARVPGMM
jgi:hypothetical protein